MTSPAKMSRRELEIYLEDLAHPAKKRHEHIDRILAHHDAMEAELADRDRALAYHRVVRIERERDELKREVERLKAERPHTGSPDGDKACSMRSSEDDTAKGEEVRKTACNYYCSEYVRLVDELARKDAALREAKDLLEKSRFITLTVRRMQEARLESAEILDKQRAAIMRIDALLTPSIGEVGGE